MVTRLNIYRRQLTGGYVPSEAHTVMTCATYTPSRGGRAIIYAHGAGGNGFIDGADVRADLEQYVARGHVVGAPLMGGPAPWGNGVCAGTTVGTGGAITAYLNWLAANYGADVSRPWFVADSHGAPCVMNWAVRNAGWFGGAVMRVPALALQSIHDSGVAGLAPAMEAAYGGLAGLVAAYPTRDAAHPTMQQTIRDSGIAPRIRLMYNAADPIAAAAPVLAIAAATGIEAVDMGGPSHAPWGYFDISEQLRFLRSTDAA